MAAYPVTLACIALTTTPLIHLLLLVRGDNTFGGDGRNRTAVQTSYLTLQRIIRGGG